MKSNILKIHKVQGIYAKHVRPDVRKKKIRVTNFDNVQSGGMTTEQVTIASFIKRFLKVEVKEHTLKHYQDKTKREQTVLKNGPCYSLASYGSDKGEGKTYRNTANVRKLYGISLDIDNKEEGNVLTIEQVRAAFPDIFNIIYTTHTSSDKHPRLRVIIFFVKPINKDDYANVFEYFSTKLGNAVDSQTKDPCRLSFYPSCPKDQIDHYHVEVNDGALFDTSIVQNQSSKPKQAIPNKQSNPKTVSKCPRKQIVNLNKLEIPKSLKKLIRGGYDSQKYQSRSEYVNDVVVQLNRYGVSDENIFSIILDSKFDLSARYSSSDQVWKDIQRIVTKASVNDYGLIRDMPPYYQMPQYLEPEQACREIRKAIRAYYRSQKDNCSHVLSIKASAGVGKTREVIDKIVEITNDDGFVEVYLPSIKLAKEFKKRIQQAQEFTGSVKILYGRDSKDAPEGHCPKRKVATSLSKNNVPLPDLLCRNNDSTEFCTFYDECGYRKQYTKSAAVAIYTHQHLFLKRNSDERKRKPDLLIIDESFWRAALESTEIKPSQIASLKVPNCIKQALLTDDLYHELNKHDDSPFDLVITQLAELKSKRSKCIKSITPKTMLKAAVQSSKKANNYQKSIVLLETLKADYERINQGLAPIFLYRQVSKKRIDQSDGDTVAWHCVQKRKKLERIYWTLPDRSQKLIPTIYIDADLDSEIADVFFPAHEFKEYYAKRQCRLWQYVSATFSYTALKRDNSELLAIAQDRINFVADYFYDSEKDKNVLVITYKGLLDEQKLELPDNCTAIYFGSYRGVDRYKNYDACVVIGRFYPPIDAIDRYGIGLWYDHDQPLTLGNVVKIPVGYRLVGKKQIGVPVLFPADHRLQVITRQVRECETLQGIDRLRLIHFDSRRPIINISNVPLDIDVYQLVFGSRAEIKINRIVKKAENNVISLHSKYLYRDYDDMFASEDDTKKTVQRWKDLFQDEDNHARISGRDYVVSKYSFNPRGGRPSYCLHRAETPDKVVVRALQRIHENSCKIKLFR
ncbi:hypothetical protein [Methylomonas sp. MgM2]